MSVFESPLKSAAATGSHSSDADEMGSVKADPVRCVPSMNHNATWPVRVLCHKMSGLPSPLKSVQLVHGAGATSVIVPVAGWPSALMMFSGLLPGNTPLVDSVMA